MTETYTIQDIAGMTGLNERVFFCHYSLKGRIYGTIMCEFVFLIEYFGFSKYGN